MEGGRLRKVLEVMGVTLSLFSFWYNQLRIDHKNVEKSGTLLRLDGLTVKSRGGCLM